MRMVTPEDALVARITRVMGRQKAGLAVGLGDDAAVLEPRPGVETILTCDWFLEGSHFLRDKHPADAVGWKALVRAASDIAAMGGKPRYFLLSLAIPNELTRRWLNGFLKGLRKAAKALGCEMAGGDTTQNDKVLISVTVIGEVDSGRAVRRSTAMPGDLLFVSGTLGGADLGLRKLLKNGAKGRGARAVLRKHLYPEPRFEMAHWLSKGGRAAAMMDISDGLSTDLARMCVASGVGARVRSRWLPLDAAIKGEKDATDLALHGGDEYELLVAVRPHQAGRLSPTYRGVRLTRIGEFTAEKRMVLESNGDETELMPGGWDPFREKSKKRR